MENQEYGKLVVAVRSARGAFPLEGAQVRVYSSDDSKKVELLHSLTTDFSGRTEEISLPAPPRSASLSPDSTIVPYSNYIIDTDIEGYYSVQNVNAPIYSGITSIQNVSMIPDRTANRDYLPKEDINFSVDEGPNL